MSDFLGYDVERIIWLRDAMRRSDDELLRFETADPVAIPARGRLRRARSILGDVWLPMLEQLLNDPTQLPTRATALVDVEPRTPWDLLLGLVDQHATGGTADQLERAAIARDQRRALEEAMDLAALLDGAEAWDLVTSDAELVRLTEAFVDIAASATAAAAFVSTFGDWEQLMAALATEHASAEDRGAHDPVDQGAAERFRNCRGLLAAIAAVITGASLDPHRPGVTAVVAEIDPYAAALILPHLQLSGERLADEATRIVRRWHDVPSGDVGWIDFFNTGDNTIDLVFRELVTDPEAAALFLDAAVDRPQTVVMGGRDPANMERLLQVGVGSMGASPSRVGAVVVPTIDWVRNGWRTVGPVPPGATLLSRSALSSVLAGWVLYLGPRAEQWGWTYEDGDDALRWVIEDDAALQRFLDGLTADQLSLGDLPFSDVDGRIEDLLVREQTGMFSQLEKAIADERIDDAEGSEFWVDLAFASVRLLAGNLILPTATGMAAVARDAAVSTGVALARRTLERNHLIPRSAADVSEQVRRGKDQRSVDRAVIATVGVVAQLVEIGALDEGVLDELELAVASGDESCGARETSQRLNGWVDSLATRLTPEHYNLVVAVRNGFLNEENVVDICS